MINSNTIELMFELFKEAENIIHDIEKSSINEHTQEELCRMIKMFYYERYARQLNEVASSEKPEGSEIEKPKKEIDWIHEDMDTLHIHDK